MYLVLNLIVIIFFIYKGYVHTRASPLHAFYLPGILVKLAAGITLGLIYRYYYQGGDTFSLFEAAISLKIAGFSSFENFVEIYLRSNYELVPNFNYTWIPTPLFIKILSFFTLITGDNYWLTSIYFSLISFISFWLWTQVLLSLTKDKWIAAISGLFIPSLVFWTSGVLKETLAISALAVLLTWITRAYFNNEYPLKRIFVGLVLFLILALLKFFIAGILLASMLALFAITKILSPKTKWYYELGLYTFFLLLLGLVVSFLHPNLWPSRIAWVIYNNYLAYETMPSGAGMITFNSLAPNILAVIISMPKAVIVGLFYPLLPLENSSLSLLAVIENWVLLLGTIALLANGKLTQDHKLRKSIWAAVLFIIISAGLITLSTPNAGTLSRYKTSYLILFAPLIINGIFTLYRKWVRKG